MHNLCSRADDWRSMQVLDVPSKFPQSRVVQISFPDVPEPKVYGVVARAWAEGEEGYEGLPPVLKDFALRCLDACLASDGGSGAVDAEERRGERLRLCIRWLQLFHEDKRFAAQEMASKSSVFESEHPYPHNADVRHKISFPGAERLEITFDERCRTETGCDYLQFYDSAGAAMIGRSNSGRNSDSHWHGVNGVPALVHRGSSLEARFRSDGSVNDWGYLFTVRAYYPEIAAGNTQSFPHIAAVLKGSFESIAVDACFSGDCLVLPKSFSEQMHDKTCISRCFLSQARLKRVQTGMVAAAGHIMSQILVPAIQHSPLLDLASSVVAISVVSPSYFVVSAISTAAANHKAVTQKSHAFKVGDRVRLVNPLSRTASSAESRSEVAAPLVIMQVTAGAALNVRHMNSLSSGVVGMLKAGQAFAFTHIANGWAKLSPAHFDELQHSTDRCYVQSFVSHDPEVAGWCVMDFDGKNVFDEASADTKAAVMNLLKMKRPGACAAAHAGSVVSSPQMTKAPSVGVKAVVSGPKSKGAGTVIQVKSTRCVVKGLTGGRPYTFKHEQLELADVAHDVSPNDDLFTVTASDVSNEPVLLELQCTVLTRIWAFVSARCTEGMSLQEICSVDRQILHKAASIFDSGSCIYHITKSVGPALVFLRMFSSFATFIDRVSLNEWTDSDSILMMQSTRATLRSLLPLMPRVLNLFPAGVFPRAAAALLSFIIRGNSKAASSASVSYFQLSASIFNILQDQMRPHWPSVIELLYSKAVDRHHDPLGDLLLLSTCKELDGSFSENCRRVFESEHPHARPSVHQHELSFPGMF